MPSVNVSYGIPSPTHDLSLSDGSTTYGLIFAKGGTRVLQEMPLSPPAQAFAIEQRNWIGGRGRLRYDDDPTGFFDSDFLWSMTDGKLMPSLQWRFCQGLRNAETSLPGNNSSMAWWKLYGNTPASLIARYLSISFAASASYAANAGYLWIRRRGTPGTLTFELCANSSGSPGTVLQTVTKSTSDITDTVSVFTLFNWTGTESLTSSTTYHIKIYGASSDSSSNHWEVLGNSAGTSSKYSTDNSSWTAASISLYYRIVDADTNRQWKFFSLEGGWYAVSINDDGTTSLLRRNGVRGTATSATSTTLTDTNVGTMVTNRHAGAIILIFDGTGDGQARVIASNTADTFTVTTAFDITPDTTSRYIVYASDFMPACTGTPGIGAVKGRPAVVGAVAYIPQGQGTAIRRMRVNASSHDFAADSTNKADHIYLNIEGAAPQVVVANAAAATVQLANVVTWGTDLTLGVAKAIGSSVHRITNLFAHNKLMRIFKEDGVYTYNNGVVERDGNNFGDIPDPTTGLGVGAQNGALWFSWAHSVIRQIGSSYDDMMNFKRGYDGILDPRRGYVSCIVSAVGWLFFVIDGGTTEYSSILVWNGMGWHEIFRGWAVGVRIRNAAWQPQRGYNGRLWFDVNGDMAYIDFPRYAANPLKDTLINYHHEGVVVSPTYDAHDQNLYKIFGLLRVYLESGTVEIDYQTNANVGTSNWTVLGTASTAPVSDIDVNLGGIFQIRFRFRLQVTSSRTPALLHGWQINGRMMEIDRYQYMCTFRADSDAETKTDEPDHSPDDLYDQLVTWASRQTRLTLHSTIKSVDNNTVGRTVSVALPSKHVRSLDTEENKWTGEISVAILEV